MPDRRNVVGDMAGTSVGVVVAELNIEAPMEAMASSPMGSHQMLS